MDKQNNNLLQTLDQKLNEKESKQIKELNEKILALNDEINEYKSNIEEQKIVISDQEKELNILKNNETNNDIDINDDDNDDKQFIVKSNIKKLCDRLIVYK